MEWLEEYRLNLLMTREEQMDFCYNDDIEELDVSIYAISKSGLATLLSVNGNKETAVWIPISQIVDIGEDEIRRGLATTVTDAFETTIEIKRWIVEEKGLF